jgi:hypothetical protein
VLLREHRDTASAEAFFEQALGRSGQVPSAIITDNHQPYVKAIQRVVPTAMHVRSGLHRASGETTKPIERSHVPTRDRLRSSRGLKTLGTGQRFRGRLRVPTRPAGRTHPIGSPVADVFGLGQPAGSRANGGRRRAGAGHALEQKPSDTSAVDPFQPSLRPAWAGSMNRPSVPLPNRSTTRCRKLHQRHEPQYAVPPAPESHRACRAP